CCTARFRSGSCPLWVISDQSTRRPRSRHVRFAAESGHARAASEEATHAQLCLPQAHHCAARRLAAKLRPRAQKPGPLFEHGTWLVGGLRLVLEDVSERSLNEFAREVGAFGGPGLERRAEAVDGDIAPVHAF